MTALTAWVLGSSRDGPLSHFTTVSEDELPAGDVTVAVAYSALNFKDAMILNGDRASMVRRLPMVPGIDFAGTVIASSVLEFSPGDQVVATGWGLGEEVWGGYCERARVPADWLVRLPTAINLRSAVALGTAGPTAAMAQDAMARRGGSPGEGPVLVTGAAGGVGLLTLAYLRSLGYDVFALVRDARQADFLASAGFHEIVHAASLSSKPTRTWAAAVDCVGGAVFEAVLPQVRAYGCICAVGSAAGATVTLPLQHLVARGVDLLGIYSVRLPRHLRLPLWRKLAESMDFNWLASVTRCVSLPQVLDASQSTLRGDGMGRTVVEVKGS
jgi:acrylyl-CoA reductase (NADPH)